jgi:hypothetical protein
MHGEEIAVPIFKDPLFKATDHGVRNWNILPGQKLGKFAGEDSLGWGIHRNGTVDVLNLRLLPLADGRISSWGDLVQIAGIAKDLEYSQTHPDIRTLLHEKLMRRMIVQVRLELSDIQRIPDPREWDVVVAATANSIRGGSVGKLRLKPGFSEKTEKARYSAFSLRESKPNFNKGAAPWSTRSR